MLRRPPSLDVRHIDAKQPDDDLNPDAHPTLLCMFPSMLRDAISDGELAAEHCPFP